MDVRSVLDKAKDMRQQAHEAGRDAAQEAVDSLLKELQGLKPLLARYGFSMGNISIGLGLPPSCVVAIKHDREGTENVLDANAEENLSTVQSLVVKGLKNAYTFAGMFQKYGYVIGQISIEVGLIPKVTVVLNSLEKPS